MAHGYLGDGFGTHGEIDPDRDDHRERDWRQRDSEWSDRDQDRGRSFGGRERNWSDGARWSNRESHDLIGDSERGRGLSSHPDDHYRSWRDRHMSELDRDYADYCREREQAFHRDFDTWRNQRHGNPQPLRTGMAQTGMSHDPTGELELTNETSVDTNEVDPMADATLGTNSSESTGTGRRRR